MDKFRELESHELAAILGGTFMEDLLECLTGGMSGWHSAPRNPR